MRLATGTLLAGHGKLEQDGPAFRGCGKNRLTKGTGLAVPYYATAMRALSPDIRK
jgi:hypothetical protein